MCRAPLEVVFWVRGFRLKCAVAHKTGSSGRRRGIEGRLFHQAARDAQGERRLWQEKRTERQRREEEKTSEELNWRHARIAAVVQGHAGSRVS